MWNVCVKYEKFTRWTDLNETWSTGWECDKRDYFDFGEVPVPDPDLYLETASF